jgi:hypothetical protein
MDRIESDGNMRGAARRLVSPASFHPIRRRRRPVVADYRRTPADRPDRASRAAGVRILYSGRPGRIRRAMTRASRPRWLPSGVPGVADGPLSTLTRHSPTLSPTPVAFNGQASRTGRSSRCCGVSAVFPSKQTLCLAPAKLQGEHPPPIPSQHIEDDWTLFKHSPRIAGFLTSLNSTEGNGLGRCHWHECQCEGQRRQPGVTRHRGLSAATAAARATARA